MSVSSIRILWLESGDLYTVRRGIEAGRRRGIHVDSLEVLDLEFATDEGRSTVTSRDGDITQLYDAVIIRSFMPYLSESLTIARVFSEAGKVVVDACLTDEGYAISKMHDYLLLARAEVAVPRTYQCFNPIEVEERAAHLGYPCVLKGTHGSEGRHVSKADTVSQLRHTLWRYKPGELMVQEYLSAEVDYRVMVIGYRALPVMVCRRPRPGEFRTNFDFQEEVTLVATTDHPELQHLAERAARTLRREFSGVDIRYRGETPLVLEANRRPGFKAFEEATKYDVAGDFIEYVAERCRC